MQVCLSLADSQTRRREVTALAEAMQERGLTTGLLVTRDDEERIPVPDGEIEVVPLWRFLLDEQR